MRLESMTPSHLRRAIDLYMKSAWPNGTGGPPIDVEDLCGSDSLEDILARFERNDDGGPSRSRRYALRLGNSRYPFMKFVVQEYLVNGEFFFSVDTHDNLEMRPDAPDYAEWEKLKKSNRKLKHRIEEDWTRAGLPTNYDLRTLMEEIARIERGSRKRRRILLVDDEEEVAAGLSAVLAARGYDVEVRHDGRSALERLEKEPRPDLLLLDYELPGLDGEEVLEALRRSPRLENLPVLMATASSIDLERLQRVSGFLRKPYPRHVLFEMIARLIQVDLEREKRAAARGGARADGDEAARP